MEKSRKKFIDVIDKAIVVGNTMDRDELLFSYKGILYPVALCSLEVFRAMESFEARSDDVILAGYPKSGTNWVGQILSDLVATFEKKRLDEEKSVNHEELEEFPYLEIGDTEKYEILLLIRNPKDVATSFFHFSNAWSALPSYETWDDFFVAFMTEKKNEKTSPEDLLFSYDGILYPAAFSSPETLEALKSFETRSSDVILAGYPKTGTNWLEQMVREIESTDAKYTEEEMKERINAEKELQMFPRLEFGDPGVFERMKKLPSRRIILTHLSPHLLPPSVLQGKAKILLLVRNPKDTAVSYYHFYNNMPVLPSFASWDEYFTAFMNGKLAWGSYFDHLMEWNRHIDHERMMMISYEELKENPVLGMKKIAAFFGFSLSEEEFSRIARKTSFQAMKEKSKETHGKFGDILFRKGVVGSWRDLFSEVQNEEMDQKFEECIGGTILATKIKYDIYCKT
uniref:Sulfotransferase n=1 Tax=Meleagris gallopavo TaxID=9103 RepID=A0A803Y684_MELGA